MLKRTQSFLYSINATAIFCLIGLMPLIGDRVIDSLAILLVLNLTLSREIIRNLKRNLVVCTLLIQYPIINLMWASLIGHICPNDKGLFKLEIHLTKAGKVLNLIQDLI